MSCGERLTVGCSSLGIRGIPGQVLRRDEAHEGSHAAPLQRSASQRPGATDRRTESPLSSALSAAPGSGSSARSNENLSAGLWSRPVDTPGDSFRVHS